MDAIQNYSVNRIMIKTILTEKNKQNTHLKRQSKVVKLHAF